MTGKCHCIADLLKGKSGKPAANEDCKFDVSQCVPRLPNGKQQTAAASTLLCGGPGRGICQSEGCYCFDGFLGAQCEKEVGKNNAPNSITFNAAAARLRAAAQKHGYKA